METSNSRKRGMTLLFLSLLLALFLTLWPILYYRLPTGVSAFTVRGLITLVGSCIGMALAIMGIRQAKRAAISCSLVVLSVMSLSINGLNVIWIPYGWLNPPEVKGIVHEVGDDFISMYPDKAYREKLHLEDSQCPIPADCIGRTDLTLRANISSRTSFYEQYGRWFWEKRAVSRQNIREGQHIQIKHNGWIYLDGTIIESWQVIILNH